MAASLVAAGVIMAATSVASTAMAIDQRNEAKKDEKKTNAIAAQENENARYAGRLEKQRVAQAKQYEPAYTALTAEVEKKPVLAEAALPLTSALAAGEDFARREAVPGAERLGAAPGTVRASALDSMATAGAVNRQVGAELDLARALQEEDFMKRKGAIDAGKRFMG